MLKIISPDLPSPFRSKSRSYVTETKNVLFCVSSIDSLFYITILVIQSLDHVFETTVQIWKKAVAAYLNKEKNCIIGLKDFKCQIYEVCFCTGCFYL